MVRALICVCLMACSLAFRTKHKTRNWKTTTDSNTGACAGHVAKQDLPIYFPLYCSGSVTNLKLRATARGHTSPRLRLSIGSIDKGYRTFPIYPATRTWEVSHDSLSAGLHSLRYSGDRLSFESLEVTGNGAGCSLVNAPGYDPSSFINNGLDIVTRVVGPTGNNFSDASKQQLYFAHEMVGTNSDKTISSTVIANGVWEWMLQFSQEQTKGDEWLSYKLRGGMYEESDMLPYMQVALDQLPGRFDDNMTVCEPCNSLSNIRFDEAAVWIACQGYPFSEDEIATLMASFSFVGAGSLFFHVSATSAGHLADVYAMDLLMYTVHQIIIKTAVNEAGSALTQAEKDRITFLDKGFGLATEKAKDLTTMFRQSYDPDVIFSTLAARPPNYILSIVTIVLTVVESMNGQWPIPGLSAIMTAILDSVLDMLGGSDVEWVQENYLPAIKKMFQAVSYCGDRSLLVGRMLNFGITFLEAFVFQEELIEAPSWVRDLVGFLDLLGISTNEEMAETWDIYNSQLSYCHERSPHATWHEWAAHGLLHISNVADLMTTGVKRGSC